jgi:predicted phosphoribosyltransferase
MIFENRIDAAKKLAKNLEWVKKDDPVILAIPRGGVVIGDIVSSILNVRLDIIISKKIAAPHNPEFAIGAVMPDGRYVSNEDTTNMLNVPQDYIDAEISTKIKEIERRLIEFRGHKKYELKNKTVVLLDDGVATGATMFAAASWVRNHNPKKLIIAIPVGPKETIDQLSKIADKVVALQSPDHFNAVGEFYREFNQIEDYQVKEIMRKHGHKII